MALAASQGVVQNKLQGLWRGESMVCGNYSAQRRSISDGDIAVSRSFTHGHYYVSF